ncbi:MAG: ABC transporter permease, partial [Alphaproteobacteria bacterium]
MRKPLTILPLANAAIYLYILAPVIVVVALAFSGSSSLAFPPPSLSLRWFAKFFTQAELVSALGMSLALATLSCLISLAL